MNLNLKFDPKKVLDILQKSQSYIFGLALIGVFGYTAYVVNNALNVKPADSPSATIPTVSTTFDKSVITTIKGLEVVPGTVPSPSLGKSDPFGN